MVRADLPLGAQLAQTIHAAGESSPGAVPDDTRAVALHAKDEAELLALESRLRAAGVRFVAVREPDPPYDGQLMAVGVEPQPRTPSLRKLMSGFLLARGTP